MKKESFKQGITDGIPIALGYLAVSFTFGMMAVQGGLSIWQAVLISLESYIESGYDFFDESYVSGTICRS